MLLASKNNHCIILYDDEDHELISKYHWNINNDLAVYSQKSRNNQMFKVCSIYMHRLIMNCVNNSNIEIDHINHNTLDNRKSNLRFCSHMQNTVNKIPYGKSKYLGVTIFKTKNSSNKYYTYIKSVITVNKKQINLGNFKTEELAAKAYDNAAKLYHGEFANLNIKKG